MRNKNRRKSVNLPHTMSEVESLSKRLETFAGDKPADHKSSQNNVSNEMSKINMSEVNTTSSISPFSSKEPTFLVDENENLDSIKTTSNNVASPQASPTFDDPVIESSDDESVHSVVIEEHVVKNLAQASLDGTADKQNQEDSKGQNVKDVKFLKDAAKNEAVTVPAAAQQIIEDATATCSVGSELGDTSSGKTLIVLAPDANAIIFNANNVETVKATAADNGVSEGPPSLNSECPSLFKLSENIPRGIECLQSLQTPHRPSHTEEAHSLVFNNKEIQKLESPNLMEETKEETKEVVNAALTPLQESALRLKELGNALLQKEEVTDAIAAYTEAILADPVNHVLYSNRSAAWSKLNEYTKALADAEKCVELNPLFLKGHRRRAAALLALKRPLDAIKAANLGLSFSTNQVDSSADLLHDIKQKAQMQLLDEIVKGRWKGTVHPSLGGYEQSFEFNDNSTSAPNMIVTVMNRPVPARYVLRAQSGQPLGMDVTAAADNQQPFLTPPTVPYIFKLSYVHPETNERVPYEGFSDIPMPIYDSVETLGISKEEVDSEWEKALNWEMEMCAPYMAVERPNTFEGPGVVIMQKCNGPEAPRRIDSEIENLCFDDQLGRYFTELLKLHPENILEEPSPTDDEHTAAKKISNFMQCQTKIFEIGRRFPDPVSQIAEQLIASPAQFNSDIVENEAASFLERQRHQEAQLSDTCQTLLRDTRVHVNQSGFNLLQLSISSTLPGDIGSVMSQQPVYEHLTIHASTTSNPTAAAASPEVAAAKHGPIEVEARNLLDRTMKEEEPGRGSWVEKHGTAIILGSAGVLVGVAVYLLMKKKRLQ